MNTIKAAAIAAGAVLALAACGATPAPTVTVTAAASSAPKADAFPEVSEADGDRAFVAKFGSEQSDAMSEVATEGGAAGDALRQMDIPAASAHIDKAVSLLSEVQTDVAGWSELDDSPIGQDTMDVLALCEDAWSGAGKAINSGDLNFTAAEADLGTCASEMDALTARVKAVNQ